MKNNSSSISGGVFYLTYIYLYMKKTIRLTESDITNIVKRTIMELDKSKNDNFKKFLKDKFDFELEVKLIETYDDIPTKIRDLVSLKFFKSQINAFGPLYLIKFKDRTFLFVDSEEKGGFALEIIYLNSWENGTDIKIGNYMWGDRIYELFNISEIGLDLIFIIKLYL
jgi:HD superfamily phosphohydrolase